MQRGFFVDLNRCTGCRACVAACRNWKGINLSLRQVYMETDYFLSLACNHCENPECFRVCPQRTYSKRRDGIVLHNSGRCTGCNRCIRSCPFKAPRYNPATGKIEKCDLCVERIDNGIAPACVEACPVKALQVLELDAEKDFGVKWVPGLAGIQMTRPNIRFNVPETRERHLLL
ncbi:MAG: hypothetical protein PWR22_2179 [Moorella sp. (in: firmicutes)]|jgi:anaerobic dimethyl sulfoxide reductase subunit B (iron-sulfur subunit)|nr:hypothetical protein [Moorella sp. (in: firmicutes)]